MTDQNQIPSLFDHLNNLTSVKAPWSDEAGFKKNYSQYMINRFVGMSDNFLPLIQAVIEMGDIPDDVHYNFLQTYLPRQKVYFKYISKGKNKKEKENVRAIMSFLEVSETEAFELLSFIPADHLKDIHNSLSDGGIVSKRTSKKK